MTRRRNKLPDRFAMIGRTVFLVGQLAAVLSPVLTAWLLIVILLPPLVPPAGGATPNPVPLPLMGPLDVVAYVNPEFAGTLGYWTVPWMVIFAGFVGTATAIVRFGPAGQTPAVRRPGPLLLAALTLGLVFTLPWFDCLVTLMFAG